MLRGQSRREREGKRRKYAKLGELCKSETPLRIVGWERMCSRGHLIRAVYPPTTLYSVTISKSYVTPSLYTLCTRLLSEPLDTMKGTKKNKQLVKIIYTRRRMLTFFFHAKRINLQNCQERVFYIRIDCFVVQLPNEASAIGLSID